MQSIEPSAVTELKPRHRATWAAGSYPDVADRYIPEIGRMIVDRLGVAAGGEVLDVCTGAGLAAIPAARTGARVTALDLVPELLAGARRRRRSRSRGSRETRNGCHFPTLPSTPSSQRSA